MSGLIQLVNLVLSTVAFALVARWYVLPRLRGMSFDRAVQPFLLLHSFRHIGMMFLASGATKATLADGFAIYAAYGDLATSLIAFLALGAVRLRWALALPMVWFFNVVGSLDLIVAVSRGVWHDAASGMGATFWIPSVIVPALLVTHALVFLLLVRGARAQSAANTTVRPVASGS